MPAAFVDAQTAEDLVESLLTFRLADALLETDGLAPADELRARFPEATREELVLAKELLGARAVRSSETGRWWIVLAP